MNHWEKWHFHLLTLLLSTTGVAYFWMKYFVRNPDPFALANHPWQQSILKIHIFMAPFLILALGMILKPHVLQKLRFRDRPNLRSGFAVAILFPIMVLSGYAPQVVTDPRLAKIASAAHLIVGVLFALGYAVHQIVSILCIRMQWRRRAVQGMPPGRSLNAASWSLFAVSAPRPSSRSARADKQQAGLVRKAAKAGTIGSLLLLATLWLVGFGPFAQAAPLASKREIVRQVYLMGTRCTLLSFPSDHASGVKRLESMIRVLEDAERELSTWKADSVLSRLNRQPIGLPLALDTPWCRLLGTVIDFSRQTGGAFDPGIGALVEAWEIRGAGREPSQAALQAARESSGVKYYRVDEAPCRISKIRGIQMDCGAFGKGVALDRLLAADSGDDPWLVDLGGQILVHGVPPDQTGWTVSLAHPRRREEAFLSVTLTSGSLSTSGGSEKDMEVNGRRVGHILDPNTGRPAEFNGSVTVWYPQALAADILSTALYVMGPEAGLAWADSRSLAACFLVLDMEKGVKLRASREFARYFLRSVFN